MAAEDLDLEFEEEKEKKSTTIDLDSTLTFGLDEVMKEVNASEDAPPKKEEQNANAAKPQEASQPEHVEQIIQQNKTQTQINSSPQQQSSKNANATISELLEKKILNHDEKLEYIISRLAKLESKNGSSVDLKKAKVLEKQVTQLLIRINAKAPSCKAELQMIKKIVNSFVKKI